MDSIIFSIVDLGPVQLWHIWYPSPPKQRTSMLSLWISGFSQSLVTVAYASNSLIHVINYTRGLPGRSRNRSGNGIVSMSWGVSLESRHSWVPDRVCGFLPWRRLSLRWYVLDWSDPGWSVLNWPGPNWSGPGWFLGFSSPLEFLPKLLRRGRPGNRPEGLPHPPIPSVTAATSSPR